MSHIDVVIPCYNYARFLQQSVRSVLEQEGVDVRVLIIDDCSGDDTKAVGQLLAAQDRRVEFRRHATNMGHIATYNEGLLGWASSDYSLLLSADDALAPGALARATGLMELNSDVGMACGMGRIIWNDDVCPAITGLTSPDYKIVSGSSFLRHCFANGNGVCTPTAVVRTELQHRLGGYRADLPHSGDMEMWMRFAAHAPVAIIRAVQACYRKHSENMSHRYDGQTLGDRLEVIQACEQILAQWGDQFPDSGSWRGIMLKRISAESCWLASQALDNDNTEDFKTCLEFAEQIYPEIRFSLAWWKLRAKRAVGSNFWKIMLPAWRHFRKLRSFDHELPQTTQLTGWWPGLPSEL